MNPRFLVGAGLRSGVHVPLQTLRFSQRIKDRRTERFR